MKNEKTIEKNVKPFGNTGHITLPKKLVGKQVEVKIKEDEKGEKKCQQK
ncbi:DUF2080 family transposase-associated protein [Methanococcus maripaludis]|nr:DUF2080 family transposase-associated protein [Methanococcus maripaludis]